MRKNVPPDIAVQVLRLIKDRVPHGALVTDNDWNIACEIVYAMDQLWLLEWKREHLTIEQCPRLVGNKYVWA